jgi:hypothetical protein
MAPEYIYAFHKILEINSDYFREQHKWIGRCNADAL